MKHYKLQNCLTILCYFLSNGSTVNSFAGDNLSLLSTETHKYNEKQSKNSHQPQYRQFHFSFPSKILNMNINENNAPLQTSNMHSDSGSNSENLKPHNSNKKWNTSTQQHYNKSNKINIRKTDLTNNYNCSKTETKNYLKNNLFTTNLTKSYKNNSNVISLMLPITVSISLLPTSSLSSSPSTSHSTNLQSSESKFHDINKKKLTSYTESTIRNDQFVQEHNNNITTTTTTTNFSSNKTNISSLHSYFSNPDERTTNKNGQQDKINDGNVIISSRRDIRDVSNFEEDEIGWTNINEEVDMTIPLVLSHFQKLGMTHFKLPNIRERISVSPAIIPYLAELTLFNGAAYNIEGIYRNGNSMMTYHNKAFQFRLNLIIKKLQFEYDFIAKAMILSIGGGVVGTLENILISSNFSIDVRDPVLRLNDFHIEKFGNLLVQLNHNRIVQELSTFVLTPITNLFRDRLTTTISSDIKETIAEMLIDFSNKDQLGIKKFTKQTLSGLIRSDIKH